MSRMRARQSPCVTLLSSRSRRRRSSSRRGMSETTMLLPTITEALGERRADPPRRRLHVLGQRRLPHRRHVHVRADARSRGRVAADLRVARGDGRRVGAVRGVGAAAARRHRRRARVRVGPRRSERVAARDAHAAARPVLPRAARRRLRVAVGAAGRKRCSPRPDAPSAISPRSSCGRVATRRAARRAAVSGDFTVDDLLAKDYVVAPLREHDIGPPVDGAAAVVLVAGDRARDLVERPAWIAGHRPPRRSALPGRARSRDVAVDRDSAAERAGVGGGGVEVAELTAVCSADELVLARRARPRRRRRRSTRRAARSSPTRRW